MACYPFKCPDCGKYHEEFRPIKEYAEPAECPECGAIMVRLVGCNFAPAGLVSRKVPRGCVEVGNELDAMKKLRHPHHEVSEREISEWARTTTSFQELPD